MRVKIIVDSTVDIPSCWKGKAKAVPLSVRFGQEEFLDGVTIHSQDFYDRLASSEELPTTSQPTPAAFEEAFREAVEEGYEVVCITIASKLSGTYQSATIAGAEFPGKVFVVDSRSAAIGAGILALYAMELAEQGLDGQQILEILMEQRKKIRLYFTVDTLEYLRKGGRLSGAVAMVGGLLNIKPVLYVDGAGEIKMLTTARGIKKAFAAMTQEAMNFGGVDRTKPVMLGYTGNSGENIGKYREEYRELWEDSVPAAVIGAAIGVHVGPGAVAVACFSEE